MKKTSGLIITALSFIAAIGFASKAHKLQLETNRLRSSTDAVLMQLADEGHIQNVKIHGEIYIPKD